MDWLCTVAHVGDWSLSREQMSARRQSSSGYFDAHYLSRASHLLTSRILLVSLYCLLKFVLLDRAGEFHHIHKVISAPEAGRGYFQRQNFDTKGINNDHQTRSSVHQALPRTPI